MYVLQERKLMIYHINIISWDMHLPQDLLSNGKHIKIFIQKAHNVCFDEYNYSISVEDNYSPGSLPLKKYSESHSHSPYPPNLISCELDLTSTLFCDTKILTYEIELPPSGKKVGF